MSIDPGVVADTNLAFRRLRNYYLSQLQVDLSGAALVLLPIPGSDPIDGAGEIRLHSDLQSLVAAGPWVPPDSVESFALLRPLLDSNMVDLSVDHDGFLTVQLEAGGVRCRPDDRFESWTVTSPHVGLVVCTPGGGLSMWDAA